MKKIQIRTLLLVSATAICLGGCGGKKEDAVPLRVALTDDIVSLDVAETKDVMSETVGRCVFSTLYVFDENLNLVPALVKSSKQVSELEWIYHLYDNVKFHDGSSLTAADVKFSLDRAINMESGDKSLNVIDRIEEIDAYTVKIITKEPIINLPSVLVRVSASIMSKTAMQNPDYDVRHPVGSGPFQLVEWVQGEEIRLERFDGYFKEPARMKYLTFVIEPSEQNGTTALLGGELDVVLRVSASEADYLKVNEKVALYEAESTRMELLILNPKIGPLNDIRVRQAIACAIDKENIVYNVLNGYGSVLSSMIPEPLPGFADYNGYTYDVEKSRALLKAAGYENGFDLTVLAFSTERKKLMEYLKLDLSKVNIRLNYEFLEIKDYMKAVGSREHMAAVMSWTSNDDPDSTFTQLYSKEGPPALNQSGFYDTRVEELLQQGRREEEPLERRKIYEEANQIIAGSYQVLPLYQASVLVAARQEIEGVKINSQGIFGFEYLAREN